MERRRRPPPRHDQPRPAPGNLEILRVFLNTGKPGKKEAEKLTSPEHLEGWLSSRELLPEGISLNEDDLQRAIWLRWAFRKLVSSKGEVGEREVDVIQKVSEGIPFRMVFENDLDHRFEPSGSAVMQAFGKLVQLFADARRDGTWEQLKVCGHCREIFYDHTSNHTGRWCRTRCGEYERKRRSLRRRTTGVV